MGKWKTGREKPPKTRTKAERVVSENERGQRKTGQPVCKEKSRKSRGTSGRRGGGAGMRGQSSGEETHAACGQNLCTQVSAVLPVTGPPSLPGPSESSLLAPHHHPLVRTQTDCAHLAPTAATWPPPGHSVSIKRRLWGKVLGGAKGVPAARGAGRGSLHSPGREGSPTAASP